MSAASHAGNMRFFNRADVEAFLAKREAGR
jgi:hypothetical protein